MILLAWRLYMQTAQQCQSWLTESEWQYSLTLTAKRQQEFCNGRAMVRQLLQRRMLAEPHQVDIDLPSSQAPRLHLPDSQLKLSISHSGNALAVAISDRAVGLDIERQKPRDFAALCQPFPALQGVDSLNQFYQRWTACEAYSKFSDVPLTQVLKQPLPEDISLFYLPLTDYVLCLCYRGDSPTIDKLGDPA